MPQGKPHEVSPLDHQIMLRNGSTVALETGHHRLQAAKQLTETDGDLRGHLEALTKENGFQRVEINFYRECYAFAEEFWNKVKAIEADLRIQYYLDAIDHQDALEKSFLKLQELLAALQQFRQQRDCAMGNWFAFWDSQSGQSQASKNQGRIVRQDFTRI